MIKQPFPPRINVHALLGRILLTVQKCRLAMQQNDEAYNLAQEEVLTTTREVVLPNAIKQ